MLFRDGSKGHMCLLAYSGALQACVKDANRKEKKEKRKKKEKTAPVAVGEACETVEGTN